MEMMVVSNKLPNDILCIRWVSLLMMENNSNCTLLRCIVLVLDRKCLCLWWLFSDKQLLHIWWPVALLLWLWWLLAMWLSLLLMIIIDVQLLLESDDINDLSVFGCVVDANIIGRRHTIHTDGIWCDRVWHMMKWWFWIIWNWFWVLIIGERESGKTRWH